MCECGSTSTCVHVHLTNKQSDNMCSCAGLLSIKLCIRVQDFILNQDWNDPKSQLQQCCLTLRKMGGGEPDIPVYK